ncbi:hypothetical protein L207DRAFT_479337 [Hyaloscypha variabilis F]|uniref:Uncharacterized protein n=1 Tax=Hyaloscypha variabilis (strain UAMH 11265 / GT02V1 / F) TaxID=1149755 RepID=A0A2J6SB15_HYAVF|nr:hypothetical protein L207DRAFT_479337 [Hyaloscypha variabilis F]
MDAPEDEQDVKLQRKATDFISDLSKSLHPFLWKTTKSGRTAIRRRVRVRDTDRLVNLLEPFQEDPQLLDPHLDKFVPALADALLAYLRSPPSKLPETNTQLLQPLSRAICRLLYTFCKVRGDKVIVRFFSTETRHLELLLSAIERGSQQDDEQSANPETADAWEWEERYIVLLWLSQLLLAPFDLASISSEDTDDIVQPTIPELSWPPNTPGLTLRVITLALQYLSSSGKERDAAKILLVRVAMRKDMQELGILKTLVQWALFSLVSPQAGHSTYYYIGVLSFLAGMLVSSESTTDMNPYLEDISRTLQKISSGEDPIFKTIKSSAVARKTILKLLRTITVLIIQNPDSIPDSDMAIEATIDHLLDSLADPSTPVRLAASKALSVITLKLPEEMAVQVATAVLEILQKNILYVEKKGQKRTARDLSRVNPLEWHGLMLTLSHLLYRRSIPSVELPDILNALRLGLVFEQRSTSGSSIGTNVRDAACFGIWAMARRYTTVDLQKLKLKDDVFTRGGPVSESSALQILAIELVVSASLDPAGNIRRGSSAALQELIGRHPNTIAEGIKVVQVVDYHAVALRSKAVLEVALQAAELADQYYQGLLNALLGWRGIQDGDDNARRVAADAIGKLVLTKQVTKTGTNTGGTWKVVKNAMDLVGQRLRALAAREIEERHGLMLALAAIVANFNRTCTKERITAEIDSGLEYPKLLVKQTPGTIEGNRMQGAGPQGTVGQGALEKCEIAQIIAIALSHVFWTLADVNSNWSSYRKLNMMAEACNQILIAACPILRADCVFRQYESLGVATTQSGEQSRYQPRKADVTLLEFLVNPSFRTNIGDRELIAAVNFTRMASIAECPPDPGTVQLICKLLYDILDLNDLDTVDMASIAAADTMLLIDDHLHRRSDMVWGFNRRAAKTVKGGRTNQGKSYIHALFKIFPSTDKKFRVPSESPDSYVRPTTGNLISTFWGRWTEFHEIEIRATILGCLADSSALHTHTADFVNMISEGLDDYTTNARGDVGSLVRIEAAKAAGALWATPGLAEFKTDTMNLDAFRKLFGKVLRAAAEKLDRVRNEGQKAVAAALYYVEQLSTDSKKDNASANSIETAPSKSASPPGTTSGFQAFSTSSKEYFLFLLELQKVDWFSSYQTKAADWARELMEGYITSADTGSEDLVRSSRAAIASFCADGHTALVYDSLMSILHKQLDPTPAPNEDRLVTPCLEVISFLFDWGFLQQLDLSFNDLYRHATKASQHKGKIRRLEACLKVYAGLCDVACPGALEQVARMALHRFPRIREAAVDECWVLKGVGKGVEWGKAGREEERALFKGLGLGGGG